MNYFIIVFFVLSSIFYSSFLSGGDQALINVNIEQSFVKRNSQLIRNLVLAVGGGSLLICRRTKILSNLIDFSAGQSIVMDLFGVGFMATAINRAVLEGCKIELNSNVSLASGVASGLTAMVLQMESLGFDLSNPLTQKHSFLGSLLICKLIIMAELICGYGMNQKTIGNIRNELLDKNTEYAVLQQEKNTLSNHFEVFQKERETYEAGLIEKIMIIEKENQKTKKDKEDLLQAFACNKAQLDEYIEKSNNLIGEKVVLISKKKDLEQQNKEIKEENKTVKEQLEFLEKEKKGKTLGADLGNLTQEKKKLEEHIIQLKYKYKSLEKEKSTLAEKLIKFTEKNNELQKEYIYICNKLTDANNKLTELQDDGGDEMGLVDYKEEGVKHRQKEISELKEQIKIKEDAILALKNDIKKLEDNIKQKEKVENELKQKLEEQLQENNFCKNKIKELEEQIRRLPEENKENKESDNTENKESENKENKESDNTEIIKKLFKLVCCNMENLGECYHRLFIVLCQRLLGYDSDYVEEYDNVFDKIRTEVGFIDFIKKDKRIGHLIVHYKLDNLQKVYEYLSSASEVYFENDNH